MNKIEKAFEIVKKEGLTPYQGWAIGGFIVVVNVEEGAPYDCMKRVDVLFKKVYNLFPTREQMAALQKMKPVFYKKE